MGRLFEFNAYTDNFSQEVLNRIKSDYNYWEEAHLMEFNISHKYLHYDRQHNEFWTSDYFNTREKKFSVEDLCKQEVTL